MSARRIPFVVLMAALVAACSTPSGPSGGSPASVSAQPTDRTVPTPIPSATPAAGTSPSTSGSASAPPIAADPPPLALREVARAEEPIGIAATDDGWLHVQERRGRVVAVDPATGASEVTLDVTDRVGSDGSEQGLLGLAFHPDIADGDRRGFVHYTDHDGRTVLSEFDVAEGSPPLRIDPATEQVLLQVDQPFANHNGGQLAFGPDGMLYMGLGDGGGGGDPFGNGQDPGTLLGTILRLDVDTPGEYGIPADNPFAAGGDGAPEVLLYGLRNPWRFSFDRLTGALWIGDVGQNAYEEIDRVDPVADGGGNLGWNVMEASHCFGGDGCSADGLVGPVSEYGRDHGCSVTGGYVYRGEAMPDLRGWYLFADYCTGLLFGVPSDARAPTPPRILLEGGVRISTFGEDGDGELYLADLEGGGIYRIVPGD